MENEPVAAYDKIAVWFDRTRTRSLIEKPWLDEFARGLREHAAILDLGCGTGEPIARYLTERQFKVTGVDGSAAMIDIARKRLPGIRLLVRDMRQLALDEKFDAAVAWHSLFHLPFDDQRAMFATFAGHLHPGGLLLFTTGSEHGETWGDNGGESLYHASLALDEYRRLLHANGFEVLRHAVDDAACGGATVWLARRLAPAD